MWGTRRPVEGLELSRRHVRHTRIYRLAILNIYFCCVVLVTIPRPDDGLTSSCAKSAGRYAAWAFICHSSLLHFRTTKLEAGDCSAAAFSATISRMSGAASYSASSTAFLSVSEDDGQLPQVP